MPMPDFDDPDLLDHLENSELAAADDLSFGLVTMDRAGTVVWYNTHESEQTGFAAGRVVIDPHSCELTYSAAGHPARLVVTADGQSAGLDQANAPPIGLVASLTADSIAHDDIVVLAARLHSPS